MSNKRRSPPTVAVIFIFVVILVGYVLSYAPYIRYRHGADDPPLPALPPGILADSEPTVNCHSLYAPVEWLIDKTPADGPMLWWAGVWDVERKVSSDSAWRTVFKRR